MIISILFFFTKFEVVKIALPLAISFFTFQQIAYLVDSYRQETQEYDFLNYCLFVTFFPQLIAGPIVHHKEMMPQFSQIRTKVINYSNIYRGLSIFTIGLGKKVLIADTLGEYSSFGFGSVESLTWYQSWVTILSYTFQIYFDFSGYTDMAIGSALIFNIKLPFNFNSPYKAVSIQEFWRRWHMTLSRWLRDYVYIPLGGNRKGELIAYRNLLLTFALGGLWHGASWTFIIWGILHGLGCCIHKLWSKTSYKLPVSLSIIITFMYVVITWIFFKAQDLQTALILLKKMFMPKDISPKALLFLGGSWLILIVLLIAILISFWGTNTNLMMDKKSKPLHPLLLLVIFLASYLMIGGYSEFLYFAF